MKKIFSLMLVGLCLLGVGCSSPAVPMQFADVCKKENNKKNVEIVGFFNNTGSAMCSSRGTEPMFCPIDFVSAPGAKDAIRASLYKGSGKSSIDDPADISLKIKDDKGEIVENSQKVKITASVFNFSDSMPPNATYAPCSLTVEKIEKAQ